MAGLIFQFLHDMTMPKRRHDIAGHKNCWLCGQHDARGIWSEYRFFYCRVCWNLLQGSEIENKPRTLDEAEQERFEKEEQCSVQPAEEKARR